MLAGGGFNNMQGFSVVLANPRVKGELILAISAVIYVNVNDRIDNGAPGGPSCQLDGSETASHLCDIILGN